MKYYDTLYHIRQGLFDGAITLPELVDSYLQNIDKNKHLNAFIEVFESEAKEKAHHIQQKIQQKKAGKLAGLVIGIKDNICFKGHQVSASSKILDGFVSLYNATVVERLLREDAIIIGRLNCDEFAMGASNENSAYGPVLNAADNTRVSGGSSGGAAVAVQANLCHAALGSDTGGSIRQPASFCGNFGLKPTYGRVSRWGLIAYASSFDIIGPITRSVSDMQTIMEVIAGHCDYDATSSSVPVDAYTSFQLQNKKYRFAYIEETLSNEGVEPEVKSAVLNTIEKIKQMGYEVEPVSFEYLPYLIPIYYTLTTAEASSNLSRYAGMHYGYRSKNAHDLETTIRLSRTEGFGSEVKRRIMLGTFVLSAGYYDAYYNKAQKVRRLVQQKTEEIFNNFDFIVSPTSPTVAFKFGEKTQNPLAMYLADIFTVHANIAGNPAISIPCGKGADDMPVGFQIMAKPFCEGELMKMAEIIHKQLEY